MYYMVTVGFRISSEEYILACSYLLYLLNGSLALEFWFQSTNPVLRASWVVKLVLQVRGSNMLSIRWRFYVFGDAVQGRGSLGSVSESFIPISLCLCYLSAGIYLISSAISRTAWAVKHEGIKPWERCHQGMVSQSGRRMGSRRFRLQWLSQVIVAHE